MTNILKMLAKRNILNNYTSEDKISYVQERGGSVYCGFDPTAPSLHIGNLLQLMVLKRFQQAGFKTIVVIGEGTAEIGDPSGKSSERVLQTPQVINKNAKIISQQVQAIIPQATILNNKDWLSTQTLLSFLRNTGKHFTINYLLAKETISNRLGSGISFTEFSYNLIQAYDFYHLYSAYNCFMQIGGSDQWGNIVSGIELIKSKIGSKNHACGLTTNLLLKKDNTKFGKTQTGTVWLSSHLTTPYELYKFFINQPDDLCRELFLKFTFLPISEIDQIILNSKNNPKARTAQKLLASEIIKLVHGSKALEAAVRISQILFTNEWNTLVNKDFGYLKNVFSVIRITNKSVAWKTVLLNNGVVSSNRQLKEFIQQKAISINGSVLLHTEADVNTITPLLQKYYIVKKGKKDYYLFCLKK